MDTIEIYVNGECYHLVLSWAAAMIVANKYRRMYPTATISFEV